MKTIPLLVTITLLGVASIMGASAAELQMPSWKHLSSKTGDLPVPNGGTQQTACVVFDIDQDGAADIVIGERTRAPALIWLRHTGSGWEKYVIDDTKQNPEAGGFPLDVDRDGDSDLIIGGDSRSDELWWYENPAPTFDPQTPWKKRLIKKGGGQAHHDQAAADFKGVGQPQLMFWNQGARKLFMAEIPANPRQAGQWPLTEILDTSKVQTAIKQEGTAIFDVDGDGRVDLLAGIYWFKHEGGDDFKPIRIADHPGRIAAGHFRPGPVAQIVIAPGDGNGPLWFIECSGEPTDPNAWTRRKLLDRDVLSGHTLEVADINADGHLDIFCAEMHTPGPKEKCTAWILYGNGQGKFEVEEFSVGIGNHDSRIADVNGDGKLDIVTKPYTWDTPRVDVWINEATQQAHRWKRHFIDDLPERAVFVSAGDLDGDGDMDLATGGWWWENQGNLARSWTQHAIGKPLQNLACLHDFDGDGDLDVLGTQGVGANRNHQFVWARNNGQGSFDVLENIDYTGDGDFLQGCLAADLGRGLQVALSWHRDGGGIHALNVPMNPSRQRWTTTLLSQTVSSPPQGEDLSAGDIDRDGDLDLLLGEKWLRNDGRDWPTFELGKVTQGEPDRVDLADIDGDGLLDAVVGLENGTDMLWFRAPEDPTQPWKRHLIGTVAGQGFSMDTADFDGDGDPDVVVGEHRGKEANRVILFENVSAGNPWREHVIDTGAKNTIDHHDGVQSVDMDGDGDLDLISIGWYNPKLWVLENLGRRRE